MQIWLTLRIGEDLAARSRWSNTLDSVKEMIELLQDRGFSDGSVIVLIQDEIRSNVVRATTIPKEDIMEFRRCVAEYVFPTTELGLLEGSVTKMLHVFGALPMVLDKHTMLSFRREHQLRLHIDLLCLLLPRAIAL